METRSGGRRERWRENIIYFCTILGGLGALTTVGLALSSLAGTLSSHSPTQAAGDALTVTEAYLRNGDEETYSDAHGSTRQSLSSSPTIEVVLHNASNRHILVEGAETTIEAYGYVYLCYSQGGGPLPEPPPHVIRLPAFPLASEDAVSTHLRDEIPPEDSDSIPLRFDAARPGLEGYGIYRVGVRLRVYGSKEPLSVGRFVLTTPARLPPYDGYFPEDDSYFKQFISGPFKQAWLSVTWCLRRNLASLHAVLAGPGMRSPELALLDQPMPASEWPRLQDRTPPHRSALLLLHQHEEALAVFAASQTHDPAFESSVRHRAATALLASAESQLATNVPAEAGEQDVRIALGLEPTARARRMLMELERRLAAQGQESMNVIDRSP